MSLFTPLTGILGGSLIGKYVCPFSLSVSTLRSTQAFLNKTTSSPCLCHLTGASASTLLLLNGDIMGFSGLINTMSPDNLSSNLQDASSHWKLVWLSTFMLTVNFYVNHVQDANRDPRLETRDVPIASLAAHVLGGFLVGLGTKLANGCTSGHGVCGMARGSRRSWTAVPIFMSASMATTALINATPFQAYTGFLKTSTLPLYSKLLGTLATAAVVALGLLRTTTKASVVDNEQEATKQPFTVNQNKLYGAAVSAILAALGLIVSGMTKKSKVNDFLDLCALCRSGGQMDMTLLAVMGSAMATSWLGYQMVKDWNLVPHSSTLPRPVVGGKFSIPTNTAIDAHLVAGALLFGMGWGFTGLCPGPALYQAAAGMSDVVLVWFPAFFAGSWAGVQAKAYWATAAGRDTTDKKNQ